MNDRVILLLKIGVAFSFLYAAVSGFIEPNNWIGFFPKFMTGIVPAKTLLMGFGILEILVASALLLMKNPYYPAILSALMLSGIIVFNLSQLDILFRDIPIILTAVALALIYREEEKLSIKE